MAFVFVIGVAQPSQAHASYYYYPPVYYPPTQVVIPPLYVSCYPEPLTASVGSNVTWVTSVSGGTGSYTYSWSGSNGNFGNGGSSLTTTYYNPGNYSAYLTVTSGSQTQSVTCSGSVSIYGNSYTYNPTPVYTAPTYYNTYSPIQVSCIPNTASTIVGSPVIWTASVVGGTYNSGYYNNNYNSYSYSWSGTDGISGYGQSISVNYSTPGQKLASVTVTGNGQTITQSCGSVVTVNGYGANYIINTGSSNAGLDIGCYSDPSTATINQPITWSAEVTGGIAPYTYSWTGSDGLTGSASSIIKYYATNGEKSAIVSVTSADGKTGTHACTNQLAVGRPAGSYVARATTNTTVTTATSNQTNNSQSAAALFSLQNIPWGWVAVLIILVLFATVLYLIFNRPKI